MENAIVLCAAARYFGALTLVVAIIRGSLSRRRVNMWARIWNETCVYLWSWQCDHIGLKSPLTLRRSRHTLINLQVGQIAIRMIPRSSAVRDRV